MWGSMLLMTMSTTVITVLYSIEVLHVPHESWLSLKSRILIVPMSTLTHFRGVCYKNHYKAVQWSHPACNIPTEVSPPVWASHPPRSPLLCLMGSSHHSCTHTIPRFSHRSFTEQPSGSAITAFPHSWLVCQDLTLPHTVPSHTHIGSWLHCFHVWSLHELDLRFGCDN
jgi:hypothetical protein